MPVIARGYRGSVLQLVSIGLGFKVGFVCRSVLVVSGDQNSAQKHDCLRFRADTHLYMRAFLCFIILFGLEAFISYI
jgi:hypothetical protein